MGFLGLAAVVVLVMRFTYKRLNAKREEKMRREEDGSEGGRGRGKGEKEIADEGDEAVTFRYLL